MEDRILRNVFASRCAHSKFLVDETLNTVECGLCHKELNPIWVLKECARTESSARHALEYVEELTKKALKKNSCKCEHCGKMTKIQKD